MPLDKTMPARGTHSLAPSWRGRGLRFSGSWSKAARTQSAMASASTVMVLGAECGVWHGVVEERLGSAGMTSVPALVRYRNRAFLLSQSPLSSLPCRTLSPCETP